MKKQIRLAIVMAIAAMVVASCGQKSDLPGYKQTKTGLYYKFVKQNKKGQQVQKGDVLVAEVTMRFNNDTIFSNAGDPQRIMQVSEGMFDGDLPEGLLMLHTGDIASFAISADTMAKFFPNQMPPKYVPGNGDKIYYDIALADIVTADELEQEKNNFTEEMEKRKAEEPVALEKYIKENNITTTPTSDGLYIIVKKKGNGAKVAVGKEVAINYTGRLLDGTIFDSSVEKDAREGNIYNDRRPYEPLTYVVGQMSLIPGWEEGIKGQPAGTQLRLIIPSSLGYGAQGASNTIPPYSPLVFDLEIVSVK